MKVGRNDPCPCGSGKKYKKCCLEKDEAAARQAAIQQSEALRMASASLAEPPPFPRYELPELPELPPLPKLTPQTPQDAQREELWEAFAAAETADLPVIFRRALAENLLNDDLSYELLVALREQGGKLTVRECIAELQAAQPAVYQQSAPYYLEWQIIDAFAEGRDELLPALTIALAETADRSLDTIMAISDRLAYHGHLDLIIAMMRRAWPYVRSSTTYMPGADSRFAADGQQMVMLDYVARTAELRADDAELLAALEFFAPVDPARLADFLALLSGQEDRPWERADRAQNDQINRLALRFQGELHRRWGMPWSRGELGRDALVAYLVGRGKPATRPQGAKSKLHPTIAARRAASLLCPDRASLDRYVAKLLSSMTGQFYQAAVMLEQIPAWLQFLQSQELISAEQRAAALADLRRLLVEATPILEQYGADSAVAINTRLAWEGQ